MLGSVIALTLNYPPGVDLGEHQRFTIPWLLAASVVMTIAAVLFGVLSW